MHNVLESRIAGQITPALEELGFDLVRVAVLGRETPTIQIMADRHDGALIAVDDCEQISHIVGAILDVDDPIPGAWTLEVSSAGIDRPLTRAKDWIRFAGHMVRVELDTPIDGRKRFAGVIIGVKDDAAIIRLEGDQDAALPLTEIRKARLVLTDALIEATAAPEGEGDEATAPRRVPKLNPVKPGKGSKPGRKVQ